MPRTASGRARVAAILVAIALGACAEEALDESLLEPRDLGATFDDVDDRIGSSPCTASVPEPAGSAERRFVSNAAQQAVHQRLLQYSDAAAAADAFTDALARSSCEPSELGSGSPAPMTIAGADDAFGASYADERDAAAFTVALVGDTVVTIESMLHQGASTADPIGSDDLAAAAVARLTQRR